MDSDSEFAIEEENTIDSFNHQESLKSEFEDFLMDHELVKVLNSRPREGTGKGIDLRTKTGLIMRNPDKKAKQKDGASPKLGIPSTGFKEDEEERQIKKAAKDAKKKPAKLSPGANNTLSDIDPNELKGSSGDDSGNNIYEERWDNYMKMFEDESVFLRDPNETISFRSNRSHLPAEEPSEKSIYDKITTYLKKPEERKVYMTVDRHTNVYSDEEEILAEEKDDFLRDQSIYYHNHSFKLNKSKHSVFNKTLNPSLSFEPYEEDTISNDSVLNKLEGRKKPKTLFDNQKGLMVRNLKTYEVKNQKELQKDNNQVKLRFIKINRKQKFTYNDFPSATDMNIQEEMTNKSFTENADLSRNLRELGKVKIAPQDQGIGDFPSMTIDLKEEASFKYDLEKVKKEDFRKNLNRFGVGTIAAGEIDEEDLDNPLMKYPSIKGYRPAEEDTVNLTRDHMRDLGVHKLTDYNAAAKDHVAKLANFKVNEQESVDEAQLMKLDSYVTRNDGNTSYVSKLTGLDPYIVNKIELQMNNFKTGSPQKHPPQVLPALPKAPAKEEKKLAPKFNDLSYLAEKLDTDMSYPTYQPKEEGTLLETEEVMNDRELSRRSEFDRMENGYKESLGLYKIQRIETFESELLMNPDDIRNLHLRNNDYGARPVVSAPKTIPIQNKLNISIEQKVQNLIKATGGDFPSTYGFRPEEEHSVEDSQVFRDELKLKERKDMEKLNKKNVDILKQFGVEALGDVSTSAIIRLDTVITGNNSLHDVKPVLIPLESFLQKGLPNPGTQQQEAVSYPHQNPKPSSNSVTAKLVNQKPPTAEVKHNQEKLTTGDLPSMYGFRPNEEASVELSEEYIPKFDLQNKEQMDNMNQQNQKYLAQYHVKRVENVPESKLYKMDTFVTGAPREESFDTSKFMLIPLENASKPNSLPVAIELLQKRQLKQTNHTDIGGTQDVRREPVSYMPEGLLIHDLSAPDQPHEKHTEGDFPSVYGFRPTEEDSNEKTNEYIEEYGLQNKEQMDNMNQQNKLYLNQYQVKGVEKVGDSRLIKMDSIKTGQGRNEDMDSSKLMLIPLHFLRRAEAVPISIDKITGKVDPPDMSKPQENGTTPDQNMLPNQALKKKNPNDRFGSNDSLNLSEETSFANTSQAMLSYDMSRRTQLAKVEDYQRNILRKYRIREASLYEPFITAERVKHNKSIEKKPPEPQEPYKPPRPALKNAIPASQIPQHPFQKARPATPPQMLQSMKSDVPWKPVELPESIHDKTVVSSIKESEVIYYRPRIEDSMEKPPEKWDSHFFVPADEHNSFDYSTAQGGHKRPSKKRPMELVKRGPNVLRQLDEYKNGPPPDPLLIAKQNAHLPVQAPDTPRRKYEDKLRTAPDKSKTVKPVVKRQRTERSSLTMNMPAFSIGEVDQEKRPLKDFDQITEFAPVGNNTIRLMDSIELGSFVPERSLLGRDHDVDASVGYERILADLMDPPKNKQPAKFSTTLKKPAEIQPKVLFEPKVSPPQKPTVWPPAPAQQKSPPRQVEKSLTPNKHLEDEELPSKAPRYRSRTNDLQDPIPVSKQTLEKDPLTYNRINKPALGRQYVPEPINAPPISLQQPSKPRVVEDPKKPNIYIRTNQEKLAAEVQIQPGNEYSIPELKEYPSQPNGRKAPTNNKLQEPVINEPQSKNIREALLQNMGYSPTQIRKAQLEESFALDDDVTAPGQLLYKPEAGKMLGKVVSALHEKKEPPQRPIRKRGGPDAEEAGVNLNGKPYQVGQYRQNFED